MFACNLPPLPMYTVPKQTSIRRSECFLSSELRGKWMCWLWAGLSPLKTLETHRLSVDYKYAWESIHVWRWGTEKLRKTLEESRSPSMFIFIYYSHLFFFLFLPAAAHVHCTHFMHTYTHTQVQTERGRKTNVPISKLSVLFFSDHPSGAVLCVIASVVLLWLAWLYICHFRSTREAMERSGTQVCLSCWADCPIQSFIHYLLV